MTYSTASKVGRDTHKRPGICPIMGHKNGPLSHSTPKKRLKKAHFVPLPYLAHNAQLCVISAYLTRIYALFQHNSGQLLYGENLGELLQVLALGGGVFVLLGQ